MREYDDIKGIVRRQMVLFFVVDTSYSMTGAKIGAVNTAIREVLPELRDIGGADVDLRIACLQFSSGCQWMTPQPVSAENFQWNNLQTDGFTDLGAACGELSAKMSRKEFLSAPSASVAPAIFLMSDGEPTDDFESGLKELKNNNWFKNAIRVAVAIGEDANRDILAQFTGSAEAVVVVHTPEALRKMIRFVSVASSRLGSQSNLANGKIETKQDAMVDQIKDFQQADPDLNAQSTSGDDW
jgi:uncharacterized protein YegL